MSTPEKQDQPCRIVGISGSIRAGSYTALAVKLALKGAEELKLRFGQFLGEVSEQFCHVRA
jgi:NAD(P)H-dependent FMN reductase